MRLESMLHTTAQVGRRFALEVSPRHPYTPALRSPVCSASIRLVLFCAAPQPLHCYSSMSTPLLKFAVAILLMSGCCSFGCVHRRLTIRSNPPGALVYVDDQEIGRTPVSTPFIYYGTRSVRLELDGYETLNVDQRFRPPWYQIPPLDFVSENLVLRDLRDERVLDFQMAPQKLVGKEELMQRANHLRGSSQLGIVAPLPNAPPTNAPTTTQPIPASPVSSSRPSGFERPMVLPHENPSQPTLTPSSSLQALPRT